MNKKQKSIKQQAIRQRQSLINIELSRISSLSVAAHPKMFYSISGKLLKLYELKFILDVLRGISEKNLTEKALWRFITGMLKNAYIKNHEPQWRKLDEVGR